MATNWRFSGGVGLALGTLICGSAMAADLPETVAEMRDGLASDAVVSLFVSTDARTAKDEEELEAGFAEDMGVGIDIRLVSGAPDPVYIQQLVQQHKAGVESPVDLFVTVPTLLEVLQKAGALAATDWAALGVDPDHVAGEIHGLFVAEFARPVIYNTNSLSPDEVPATLEELTSPEWKGKIVTAALPDMFSPWAIRLGEEKVLELVETLFVDLEVGIAPFPTAIRTLVESGEYPIGFGIRMSGEQIENNSPVAYAPIRAPLVPRYAGVIEGSKNADAATLLGWWLSATENGQRLAADVLDWPRHTTPGTDLYDMVELMGGVDSAGAGWWMSDGTKVRDAIARLLQDL